MISRLRPIHVSVSFEDRPYKLGESIGLTIEMTPSRDCHVREGRIDLVLEEQWTERSTVTHAEPGLLGSRGLNTGVTRQVGTTTVTRQITKDHKEKSVHSGAVFLEDAGLQSGEPARHNVRLQIQPGAPPHSGEAKARWWLQTVIDVAGARDIKPRHKVVILA